MNWNMKPGDRYLILEGDYAGEVGIATQSSKHSNGFGYILRLRLEDGEHKGKPKQVLKDSQVKLLKNKRK